MATPAEQLEQEQPKTTREQIEAIIGRELEPGIYHDIPNELYHRGPGISKSGLDIIARSPAHYITQKYNPKPSTPAMMLGTAFHALVLEPEEFEKVYLPDPTGGSRAKAAIEQRQQLQDAGHVLINSRANEDAGIWGRSDWDTIHYMRDAVMEHPIAPLFIANGTAEASCYWLADISYRTFDPEWPEKKTRKLCKCRPDFLDDAHNFAVDLKSALDASYSGFARACVDRRYHVAAPFYLQGLAAVGSPRDDYVFIAVEKEPPYAVGVYSLGQRWKDLGTVLAKRDLETYARCHERDEWPAYETDPRQLELPKYAEFVKIS